MGERRPRPVVAKKIKPMPAPFVSHLDAALVQNVAVGRERDDGDGVLQVGGVGGGGVLQVGGVGVGGGGHQRREER